MDCCDISVIIPVYNGEIYLEQTIESLLNQSKTGFEIIFVDDGSTDDTLNIINKFSEKDKRIRVISQKNQHAGVARNNGLKISNGEYVIFLDADDTFDSTMLEKIYSRAKETEADIVLFGGNTYNDKTGEVKQAAHYLSRRRLPEIEPFSRKDFVNKDFFSITCPAPWNKLYRKQFLIDRSIEFQNLINTNDAYVTYVSLALAEKISTVRENLINYRIGATNGIQSTKKKNPLCFIEAYDAIYNRLVAENIFNDVRNSFFNIALSCCCFSINSYNDNLVIQDIVEHIENSDFYKAGLLDSDIDTYSSRKNYYLLKSMIDGREWNRSRIQKRLGYSSYTILKDKRENKKTKISVIIPVYNVENYIEECVNSVLKQTLTDIEIICINDGSTDNSFDVLNKISDKDDRIVFVTQNNSGLSVTRNHGLEIAKGEYVCYLDSDDWLCENALEELYDLVQKDDLDVIFFDGKNVYENEETDNTIADGYYTRCNDYSGVYVGTDLLLNMEEAGEYRTSSCMQMASRDFINRNNIRFEEGILHEDNIYTFEVMMNAQRASHIGNAYYMRRVHSNSIMTVKFNWNHCYGYFVTAMRLRRILQERTDLSPEKIECYYGMIFKICGNIKRIYHNLDLEQKYYYYFLSPDEYYMFRMAVIRSDELLTNNVKYKKDIKRLKKKTENLQGQLNEERAKLAFIEGQKSYKFMMKILSPYRKLINTIKTIMGKEK